MKPPRLESGRRDFEVYYDGKGFYVAARWKKDPRYDFRDRMEPAEAFRKRLAVPIWTGNDCISSIRVVVGESSQEEAEGWLGRVIGRLDLEDGLLGLCSELPVEVPPGEYLVEAGFHLPYAHICDFARLSPLLRDELLGAWFRRTRPGETMPKWLSEWLTVHPEEDPGHEQEWAKKRRPQKPTPMVDLVVRLGRASEKLKPTPIEASGIPVTEVRKPKVFPLGLPLVDPFRMPD